MQESFFQAFQDHKVVFDLQHKENTPINATTEHCKMDKHKKTLNDVIDANCDHSEEKEKKKRKLAEGISPQSTVVAKMS